MYVKHGDLPWKWHANAWSAASYLMENPLSCFSPAFFARRTELGLYSLWPAELCSCTVCWPAEHMEVGAVSSWVMCIRCFPCSNSIWGHFNNWIHLRFSNRLLNHFRLSKPPVYNGIYKIMLMPFLRRANCCQIPLHILKERVYNCKPIELHSIISY